MTFLQPATFAQFGLDSVRTNDPDRYLLAMLAPAEIRDGLIDLYAFNVEIARTRELVSEPPLGEIRLQWWRDEVAAIFTGDTLRHGISPALRDTAARFELSRTAFDRLIDARSADLDDGPPETAADLQRYAEDTTAPLLELALEIAGERSDSAARIAREVGVAWSLAGLIRAMPYHLRARRQFLPAELVRKHGVVVRELRELKPSAALNSAVRDLHETATESLRAARALKAQVARSAYPILLQGRFAEIYLHRLASFGFDPFDPRVAETPPMVLWRLYWAKMMRRY